MDLQIVYQNDDFIALNKPSACLSTPPRFVKRDKRPVLGREIEKQLGVKVYPLHRLDYEVSGLILYALNAKSHQKASILFEKRKVQKTYFAETCLPKTAEDFGPNIKFPTDEFLKLDEVKVGNEYHWECRLLRGKKRAYINKSGKRSVTKATVEKIEPDKIHWRLEPLTGRSHQLRFELFRHGCPILGDVLYGGDPIAEKDKIALKSIGLKFLVEDKQLNLPEAIKLDVKLKD